MIRKYEKGDEQRLDPNEFSEITDDIKEVFDNDRFEKHTLEHDGVIKCIMCWFQYAPRHYAVFFLMPDGVEFRHARSLKKFIDFTIKRLRVKSVVTYSADCDLLNRWHEFFGFKLQRKPLSEIASGHNKWMMKWAGKHY